LVSRPDTLQAASAAVRRVSFPKANGETTDGGNFGGEDLSDADVSLGVKTI
jgi:hypothetical protein